MRELTNNEIRWLKVFAKSHDFFASFLLHYKLKMHLANNQYYWLWLYINQAEENGDTLLTPEELTFLEDNSQKSERLRELLEIYKDKGYLENLNYLEFLKTKTEITGKSTEIKPKKATFKHRIVKVPCPHCNSLCSTQISYCTKCGEPLPKLEICNGSAEDPDISDVDYTERNIISALEKLINKSIPLKEKFEVNSTCYVKQGDEITGLSIFNCGLSIFPKEILRIKSLKYLALRRNKFNCLPKSIGFLSNLELLDLRINELESLPNSLGLLYKLKNLNLSSNNLKLIPDLIGVLMNLKKLNLSSNKLKNLPQCIENLNCLEILNLKANYWINIPENIEKLKEKGLQILL
ncbi:MAG: leucine-rich repeat domain-containing protein [Candidatus Odinarchaeota archaeon]